MVYRMIKHSIEEPLLKPWLMSCSNSFFQWGDVLSIAGLGCEEVD
jgi:hypothetical protein